MWGLIPAFLLLTAVRDVVATDYCAAGLCQPSVNHIACLNYGEFDETCGSDAVILKFTTRLRAQVLEALNSFRNKVALGMYRGFLRSARMSTLQWHDELAGLAMFALRRCENMEPEYCANTDEFKYVSYIYGSSRGPHLKSSSAIVDIVIRFWINDINSCTMSHINAERPVKDGQCKGFFTQIVQDLAGHVGCAMMRQKSQTSGMYLYGLLCHFSRAKIVHELVYRSSKSTGDGCAAGTHFTYRGLCSPEEHVDPNALHFGSLDGLSRRGK